MARRTVRRRKHHWRCKPPLTISQILAWADARHQRNGSWPSRSSGVVQESPDETWNRVNGALIGGYRGLHGGSSLSRLLVEHRGVRTAYLQPPLSLKQIPLLGRRPSQTDWGGVADDRVGSGLRGGRRGLDRDCRCLVFWAPWPSAWAYRAKPSLFVTAGFPTEFDNRTSLGGGGRASAADGELAFGLYPGAVVGADGETWMAVSRALSRGSRGSSLGGLSLAKLLDKHRGRRDKPAG